MTRKLLPANDVANHRSPTDVWIDHAVVTGSDLEWLRNKTHLTLWNVRIPTGFLSELKDLISLDVRGGSSKNFINIGECKRLRHLSVNQVRGLSELANIESLTSLEILSLYGLPKLAQLPSLQSLTALKRVELGSLGGLASMKEVLAAPALTELVFSNKIGRSALDAESIRQHPSVNRFSWFADGGVPVGTWEPFIAAVSLPSARAMHARDWLNEQA